VSDPLDSYTTGIEIVLINAILSGSLQINPGQVEEEKLLLGLERCYHLIMVPGISHLPNSNEQS